MFHLSLQCADHVRRYSISPVTPFGWEVKLEEDHEVRRHDLYQDWHRVERAMARIRTGSVASSGERLASATELSR